MAQKKKAKNKRSWCRSKFRIVCLFLLAISPHKTWRLIFLGLSRIKDEASKKLRARVFFFVFSFIFYSRIYANVGVQLQREKNIAGERIENVSELFGFVRGALRGVKRLSETSLKILLSFSLAGCGLLGFMCVTASIIWVRAYCSFETKHALPLSRIAFRSIFFKINITRIA